MGKVYKCLRSQIRRELKQYQAVGSNPWLDLQDTLVKQRFLVYQFSGRGDFLWIPNAAVKTSMIPHLCVVASRRDFSANSFMPPYKRLRKVRVLWGTKVKIGTPAKPNLSLLGMLTGIWNHTKNKADGRSENKRRPYFRHDLVPNRFYLV